MLSRADIEKERAAKNECVPPLEYYYLALLCLSHFFLKLP